MLTIEEIEEWNVDYGAVDTCPYCGMVVPVVLMCEDHNYCEYFNEEGEDNA